MKNKLLISVFSILGATALFMTSCSHGEEKTADTDTTTENPAMDLDTREAEYIKQGLAPHTIKNWEAVGGEEYKLALFDLWEKYGIGPRDENGNLLCDLEAPNWSEDACYQYQIGPGIPDVPGEFTIWETFYVASGEERPYQFPAREGRCPHYRVDPTWVNNGLSPYFIDKRFDRDEFALLKIASNENLQLAIEWAAYLGAIYIIESNISFVYDGHNGHNGISPWETCLNRYAALGNGEYERTTGDGVIIGEIATVARNMEHQVKFIPSFGPEWHQDASTYVYGVGSDYTIVALCEPAHTLHNEAGFFGINGELVSGREIQNISERFEIRVLDKTAFRLGLGDIINTDDIPTEVRSCKDKAEFYKPQISKEFDSDDFHHVNKWYSVSSSVALQTREVPFNQVVQAVACVVGIEPNDLFNNGIIIEPRDDNNKVSIEPISTITVNNDEVNVEPIDTINENNDDEDSIPPSINFDENGNIVIPSIFLTLDSNGNIVLIGTSSLLDDNRNTVSLVDWLDSEGNIVVPPNFFVIDIEGYIEPLESYVYDRSTTSPSLIDTNTENPGSPVGPLYIDKGILIRTRIVVENKLKPDDILTCEEIRQNDKLSVFLTLQDRGVSTKDELNEN